MTEQEVKLRLPDEAAWARLCEQLGEPRKRKLQTNVYFDTPTRRLLRDRSMMVRVRESGGKLEITTKDRARRDEDAGALLVRERNARLSAEQWQEVHRGHTPLTGLDIPLCKSLADELGEPLHPIGSIVNTRIEFDLGSGFVAEVDRTELPGGRVDYEVEVECREEGHTLADARDRIDAELAAAGIEGVTPSNSKYERFLEALGEG